MDAGRDVRQAAHHRQILDGELLMKDLMNDFMVILAFVRDVEDNWSGNTTYRYRFNLVRSYPIVYRIMEKFQTKVKQLDALVGGLHGGLQLSFFEAIKLGQAPTMKDPGAFGRTRYSGSVMNLDPYSARPSAFDFPHQLPLGYLLKDAPINSSVHYKSTSLPMPYNHQLKQIARQPSSWGAIGQPVPESASVTTAVTSPSDTSSGVPLFSNDNWLHQVPPPWNPRPPGPAGPKALTADTEVSNEDTSSGSPSSTTSNRLEKLLTEFEQLCHRGDPSSGEVFTKMEEIKVEGCAPGATSQGLTQARIKIASAFQMLQSRQG